MEGKRVKLGKLHSLAKQKRSARMATMKCKGLIEVARHDARILILGTLPGGESLRQRQYYAKKTNRFWWIMGELVGASPSLPYEIRLERLKAKGIALWDVCASAEREGSLDSRIISRSVVPNDIAVFLSAHPHIELICLNGRRAEQLYRRRVLKDAAEIVSRVRHAMLPSTSPANTLSPIVKLSSWREILGDVIMLDSAK